MLNPIPKKTRIIAYVDGFNVYYGLKNASRNSDYGTLTHGAPCTECIGRSLYWMDIAAVVQTQVKKSEELVGIKYFSAPRRVPKLVEVPDPSEYVESNRRQQAYLDALGTLGNVQVILGQYAEKTPHVCECGRKRPVFEEKMTDVNIATHLICDAYKQRFDLAIVMSADGDLVAPIVAVRELGLSVRLVLPPGRKKAEALRAVVNEAENLRIRAIRKRLLPMVIERPGLPDLECPEEWRTTGSWVWGGAMPSRGDQPQTDIALDAPKG